MEENIDKTITSCSDSSDSESSEVRRSVQLMAELEQEKTPEVSGESAVVEPQSQPSAPMEKLPEEEWAKMSRNQRKHFLRKRRETRGENTRTSKEVSRAQGSAKRPRDVAGFTPSPNKEVRKKPKTEVTNYSLAVSCIKVAIVSERHPHEELQQEYCEKLIIKLMDLMCENNPEEKTINFCGYNIRTGAIVVNCVDEESKNWLARSIDSLTPWEGAHLKTCDIKDLEGFKKISIFIPKPIRKIQEILTNLKRQNGVDTDRWKILPNGVKTLDSGVFFVASIPESQFKGIQKKGHKLSHGFHTVEVREIGKAPETHVSQEEEKKEEGEAMEEEVAEAVGVAAAVASVSDVSAVPGHLGGECRFKDRPRLPGARGGPAAGGGVQDSVPGTSAMDRTAGNRRDPKKVPAGPGRDPPPSSQ